jgi:hypothetical protein
VAPWSRVCDDRKLVARHATRFEDHLQFGPGRAGTMALPPLQRMTWIESRIPIPLDLLDVEEFITHYGNKVTAPAIFD